MLLTLSITLLYHSQCRWWHHSQIELATQLLTSMLSPLPRARHAWRSRLHGILRQKTGQRKAMAAADCRGPRWSRRVRSDRAPLRYPDPIVSMYPDCPKVNPSRDRTSSSAQAGVNSSHRNPTIEQCKGAIHNNLIMKRDHTEN